MGPTVSNMQQTEIKESGNKPGSKGTIVASLGALASVVAASSCCVPLFPFLFAAGAAGTSAFVGKLRPYLLVLSVLLIAFAFYKSRRAKQCNCNPGRVSTMLLWFSAVVVFVFIFFPQVIANFMANVLAGGS
jgi:hypothetical protein